MEEDQKKSSKAEEAKEKTKKEKKTNGGGNGLILAVIVLLLIGAALYFGKDMMGGAAATVNGKAVTRAEYNERVQQIENQYKAQLAASGGSATEAIDKDTEDQIKSSAIDELINEELFLQAAKEKNIVVSDTEVDAELAKRRTSYPDEASFEADLKSSGMTEDGLRTNIKNQLTIVAYAKSVLPATSYQVNDDEVQQIYKLNFGDVSTSGDTSLDTSAPTFDEFNTKYKPQIELQKLSLAVGPLVKDLRSKATIDIHVKLPKPATDATPESDASAGVKTDEGVKNVQDNGAVENTVETKGAENPNSEAGTSVDTNVDVNTNVGL